MDIGVEDDDYTIVTVPEREKVPEPLFDPVTEPVEVPAKP